MAEQKINIGDVFVGYNPNTKNYAITDFYEVEVYRLTPKTAVGINKRGNEVIFALKNMQESGECVGAVKGISANDSQKYNFIRLTPEIKAALAAHRVVLNEMTLAAKAFDKLRTCALKNELTPEVCREIKDFLIDKLPL